MIYYDLFQWDTQWYTSNKVEYDIWHSWKEWPGDVSDKKWGSLLGILTNKAGYVMVRHQQMAATSLEMAWAWAGFPQRQPHHEKIEKFDVKTAVLRGENSNRIPGIQPPSEMREQVLRVYMDDALCRGSLLIAYGAEAMFGDWWNRIFLAITIPTLDLWCTTRQVVILPSLPAISRVELLVVVKSINVCMLKAPFLVHWTIFRQFNPPVPDWLTSNNLLFWHPIFCNFKFYQPSMFHTVMAIYQL